MPIWPHTCCLPSSHQIHLLPIPTSDAFRPFHESKDSIFPPTKSTTNPNACLLLFLGLFEGFISQRFGFCWCMNCSWSYCVWGFILVMSCGSSDPPTYCSAASPELKLYQAFIFSVPVFFTFILLLLFYLSYLRRRRAHWQSLRLRASQLGRGDVPRVSSCLEYWTPRHVTCWCQSLITVCLSPSRVQNRA